jgi:hypothetical protein
MTIAQTTTRQSVRSQTSFFPASTETILITEYFTTKRHHFDSSNDRTDNQLRYANEYSRELDFRYLYDNVSDLPSFPDGFVRFTPAASST